MLKLNHLLTFFLISSMYLDQKERDYKKSA